MEGCTVSGWCAAIGAAHPAPLSATSRRASPPPHAGRRTCVVQRRRRHLQLSSQVGCAAHVPGGTGGGGQPGCSDQICRVLQDQLVRAHTSQRAAGRGTITRRQPVQICPTSSQVNSIYHSQHQLFSQVGDNDVALPPRLGPRRVQQPAQPVHAGVAQRRNGQALNVPAVRGKGSTRWVRRRGMGCMGWPGRGDSQRRRRERRPATCLQQQVPCTTLA